MSQVADWVDKLDAMTADDIANLLREEEVTGLPRSATRCPIAAFLKTTVKVRKLMVTAYDVEWWEIARVAMIPYLKHCRVGTPNGIREFVSRFDAGAFPDLAEPLPGAKADAGQPAPTPPTHA